MSGSTRQSGEAFALERLRENPDLDYSALRRAADAAGIDLQPIQFGRARRQLGMTKAATRQAPAVAPEPADDGAAPEAAATRRGKGSPDFDFLLEELRADPSLDYAELKRRTEARGLRIAPIMYGRAKAILGLVPVRPRGSGKQRKATAPVVAVEPLPRTLKQVESVAADRFHQQLAEVRSAEELLAAVKRLDAERRRLRLLLEHIADTIDEALSHADG